MNRRLNRLSIVIFRNGGRADGLADLIDVAFSGDADGETPIGGDDCAVASDFAVPGIGDAGFDTIADVVVMLASTRVGMRTFSLPSASSLPDCSEI